MGDFADIKAFFEKVAQHPSIGHSIDDADNCHFFGYNFNELLVAERSKIKYPCSGLSDNTHTSLSGTYSSNEAGVERINNIQVLWLDKPVESGTMAEEAVYDAMIIPADDFMLWLTDFIGKGMVCEYPFLKKIDLSKVSLMRIGPKGVANAFGWKLNLPFKKRTINDLGNPLNAILNGG